MDNSGRILGLKSPIDKVGEAPRATPYGLARLPKIYLQERYQISGCYQELLYIEGFISVLPLVPLHSHTSFQLDNRAAEELSCFVV